MEDKKTDDVFTRPPELTRWQAMKQFLWNPKSHEFLGRTAKSWFQITVFYIILYSFLAGFFAAMLMIFYQTLDAEQPRWQLDGSRIGNSPGMGFRPQNPSPETLTIEFVSSKEDTYKGYLETLEEYLKAYEQGEGDYETCDYGIEASEGKLCRFPLTGSIPTECHGPDYGFKSGNPCIFLKLNKVFGWRPEPFNTSLIESNTEMDAKLKERILAIPNTKKREGNVWVSCEGEGTVDKEALVDTTFDYGVGDDFGFPYYYYPYKNQKGYQAPFVVMRLVNFPKDKSVRIICRLWAQNIVQDRQRRLGMTLMEILSKSE